MSKYTCINHWNILLCHMSQFVVLFTTICPLLIFAMRLAVSPVEGSCVPAPFLFLAT